MARTSFGRGARQVAASAALVVGALTSFGAALTLDATGAHGITLAACTDSWTGSAGDGNWSTAGNWLTSSSTQAVPTSSDVACIGNNTSTTPFTVTLSSSVSVAALELGGNTASTLNSTNDAVNLGNASNDPSEIFSNGIINLTSTTGDAELFNANSSIVTQVDSGGQVNAITNGSSATYIGNTGTLTINGALNVSGTGTGQTELYNGVTVVNNGSIDVTANTLSDASSGSFTNNGTITNAATVNLSTDYIDRGSAVGANPVNFQGGTFDDDTGAGGGTYTASGSIILKGTGSNPGLSTGQTLDLNNVTGTNEATTFTVDGTINLTSTTGDAELFNNVVGDAITVASGGQVDAITNGTSATYIGNTGTLTINSGGALNVSGTGTGAGETQLYNAVTVVNNGSIDVTANTLYVPTNGGFTNNGTITNAATVNLSTDYIDRGSAAGANPVNFQGGTFDDDTGAGGGTYTASGSIILKGTGSSPGIPPTQTLDLNGVTGTNEATTFTVDGTINLNVTSGSPQFFNNVVGDTITLASGATAKTLGSGSNIAYFGNTGTLNIAKGATVDLTATNDQFYNAVAVTDNGTVTVPAGSNLTIGNTFTQGRFGTLAVTNNVTASTKSVITGGTDSLGGTLDVTTVGTPSVAYSPLSAMSSRTGFFGTLNYHGTSYSTAYTSSPNDVTLTPTSSAYGYAGLTLSSTSVGATGVDYSLKLQGQAMTAGTTSFTVTAPAGTTFPTYTSNCNVVLFDDITSSASENCLGSIPVTGGGGTTLTFTAPISAAATDTVQIDILDVTNAGPAASDGLTVNNGSVSVQLGYTLTPSTSVTNATITASSDSDQATHVVYTTTFTATNGLTSDGYSTITLTFPSDYTPPTYTSNCNQTIIEDLTTATSDSCSQVTPTTSGQSVTYEVPIAIAPGDRVEIAWSGVTNPSSSTGPQAIQIATSADPTATGFTPPLSLVAPTSVSNGTLTSVSSTSESASQVAYTTTFKATNSLIAGNATISLTLPSGYSTPAYTSNCNFITIVDETTSNSENCAQANPTTSGQTITFVPLISINPGDTVQVVWYGISNPASVTNPLTFELNTSGDPVLDNLAPQVNLTSPTGVGSLTISPSNATAGTSGVTYTANFTTTNSLVSETNANSVITMAFPTGTGLPSITTNCGQVVLDDLTTTTDYSCSPSTPTVSGETLTYAVPADIAAGDHLQLQVLGVTNPTSTSCTGSQSASLDTSADPMSESASYTIASASLAPVLAVPTVGPGQVNLSWSAPTCTNGSPISSYTVLRGTSSGSETPLQTGITGTTYQDTAVNAGTAYFYKVEAVNGVGASPPSNEESATPLVTPENTTTALTPTIATSTTYGSETTETFAGTVTGQSGDGFPQGTVTVFYGSPTQTQLCHATLSGGSGDVADFSCSLTATQLAAGSFTNVVATYAAGTSSNGNFSYNTSTSSPAQSFTVSPEAENTTTALNAVTPSVTFGSETTETFAGTVTGQSGDGFPQGTVTVFYGSPTQTQLCQSTLSGGSGDVANFSCSLTASQLAAATYSNVVATYAAGTSSNADFSYNTSTSSPAQSFTVNPSVSTEPTTTALNAVTSSITYGSETAETFTGTVTGQSGDGYPEGTVTVYYGSPTQVALCSQTLPAGSTDVSSFTCSLTATQLAAGSFTNVVAVYSPGGTSSSNSSFTYTTSTSTPAQSFTVNAASESTTTSLNAIATSTTYGSETSETFSGTVTGQSGDGIPQGSVTVSYGSATALCSVNPLSGGSGDSVGFSCSLTATQLAAGSYSNVVATFTSTGSSNPDFTYTGSASSPAQSFTVNPATTSPDNLRIQLSALGLVSNVGGLYGITVTNLASTATTGAVTITDVLPAGLSYIGVLQFPSAFHCSATLGTVTCTDTSPIAAHANDYLVLVVGVSARSGTVITNTVNLTPVGTPAGNYTATATSTVVSLHR